MEWQRQRPALLELRAGIAALSVDDPTRAEPVRRELGLDFPLLCDPAREAVRAWGLYNEREKGGIAVPATFVLDADGTVELAMIEGVSRRLSASQVVSWMRAGGEVGDRRSVSPGLALYARAASHALRRGLVTPRPTSRRG